MATREDISKGVKAPDASVKHDGSPTCPPRIVRLGITPTPSQHKQLCDDLRELRRRGAETNTAAGEGAAMKAASPSPAALAVTARVRELREAEEQDRRDRQIAAIARLLQRAAGDSRRAEGRK
jgi:hypothetical protein